MLHLLSDIQYKGVLYQYLPIQTAEHTFPTYQEITDKQGSALHKSMGFQLFSLNRKIVKAQDKLYTSASETHNPHAFVTLHRIRLYVWLFWIKYHKTIKQGQVCPACFTALLWVFLIQKHFLSEVVHFSWKESVITVSNNGEYGWSVMSSNMHILWPYHAQPKHGRHSYRT